MRLSPPRAVYSVAHPWAASWSVATDFANIGLACFLHKPCSKAVELCIFGGLINVPRRTRQPLAKEHVRLFGEKDHTWPLPVTPPLRLVHRKNTWCRCQRSASTAGAYSEFQRQREHYSRLSPAAPLPRCASTPQSGSHLKYRTPPHRNPSDGSYRGQFRSADHRCVASAKGKNVRGIHEHFA